jgi:hypothetical protein
MYWQVLCYQVYLLNQLSNQAKILCEVGWHIFLPQVKILEKFKFRKVLKNINIWVGKQNRGKWGVKQSFINKLQFILQLKRVFGVEVEYTFL